MSCNYKFHNPEDIYFVSFAAIEWLDVFTWKEYKTLLLTVNIFAKKKKKNER